MSKSGVSTFKSKTKVKDHKTVIVISELLRPRPMTNIGVVVVNKLL